MQASVVPLLYIVIGLCVEYASDKLDAIGAFSQVGELVGASREKLKALVDKHKD